ncbi:hypothetical protein HED34_07210 [Vagococcus fluvialis]|uniref:hypothetical protein n=1 Tax=Vagococcus fluvialis TaxID=2738 RepID=UPI001432C350|nr:hypothetical protein [Vagococcus fluvialis]NKC59754.1 hypothetical protein [Vagococcus fluvialis]NKD50651.1 hypothetical protein [Vagococcus fluvialis]
MNVKFNALLILFFLMPRIPIEGAATIIYPVIGAILFFLILISMKNNKSNSLSSPFIATFFSFIILLILLSLSILVNNSGISGLSSLARIIFIVIVFLYGYFEVQNKDMSLFKEDVLKTINFILVIELIVVITQLFDIRLLHPIYSMNKTLPLGTLVRVAGTFGNPNLFGWMILQIGIIILLLEKSGLKKIANLLICLILVLLSGSRVTFMVFPIGIFLTLLLMQKRNLKFYFKKVPVLIIMGIGLILILFKFLYKFQEYFPYMSQIFLVFDSRSLSSVNSFSLREMMWESARFTFSETNNSFKYLLGIGPGSFSVLDNDYLFAFINFGSIFLIIQVYPYVYAIVNGLRKNTQNWIQIYLIQYAILALVIGYQSETISGWDYPVLFYYFFGILLFQKNSYQNTSKYKLNSHEFD